MPVLSFEAARLRVRLGCGAEERRVAQDVDLAVAIRFGAPPPATETDALKDTVCYAELIDAARGLCAGREFHTIERLAQQIFIRLRELVPAESDLWLRVTKVHPPVLGLEGGVRFSLGDWTP